MGTLETVKIQSNNCSCYMWKSKINTKHPIFNDTLGGNVMIYNYELASQGHSLQSPQKLGSCKYWFSRVSGLYPVVGLNTKSLILVFLLLYFSLFCGTPSHMKRNPFLTYMSRFLISWFTSLFSTDKKIIVHKDYTYWNSVHIHSILWISYLEFNKIRTNFWVLSKSCCRLASKIYKESTVLQISLACYFIKIWYRRIFHFIRRVEQEQLIYSYSKMKAETLTRL